MARRMQMQQVDGQALGRNLSSVTLQSLHHHAEHMFRIIHQCSSDSQGELDEFACATDEACCADTTCTCSDDPTIESMFRLNFRVCLKGRSTFSPKVPCAVSPTALEVLRQEVFSGNDAHDLIVMIDDDKMTKSESPENDVCPVCGSVLWKGDNS